MSDSPSKKQKTATTYSVLGMGNPLLDILATVPTEFLDKYNLKLNNASLATEKDQPLYDELTEKFKVEYVAGGATQNSIRICQWILGETGRTAYIGSVGQDKYGDELRKCAENDGVKTHYLVHEKVPTGTCAVLVHDSERCLVANLAAAEKYDANHLDESESLAIWQNTNIVYSAGFFLSHDGGRDAIMRVAAHVSQNGLVAVNLAAPFVCTVFADRLLALIEYADFVFGNESEAKAFGEHQKFEDSSPQAVALRIAELPKKSQRPRVVVITQGGDPTLLSSEGKIVEIAPPPLKREEIVDTNGAGDAFVGGFLAGLVQAKDLKECVVLGQKASAVILKQSGAAIPPGRPDFL